MKKPHKIKNQKLVRELKGKNVLITGGAKRLGSLVALNLARKGWKILLHYNQSEAEANLTKEKIINEVGTAVSYTHMTLPTICRV